MALGWKLYGDGKHLGPTDVVAPDERLSWGRTAGLGAQHVVAMFGATFVFPLIMGLNPQLAIMMSGIATICFLLIVKNKVPSYLGTSAAFVGGVVAIYAQNGTPMDVTGAILVAGVVLAGCRPDRPLRRSGPDPRGPAARRHRRRRHADRLQPRTGRRHHLLAAGPVDRLHRDDRGHRHGVSACAASSAASRSSSASSSATPSPGSSTRASARSRRTTPPPAR